MTARPVGGMRKHPLGRVDQLEDRYLGMVEAPSSNLGTSTRDDSRQFCWPFSHKRNTNKRFFCWLGMSTIRTDFINSMVECASTNPNPTTFVDCSHVHSCRSIIQREWSIEHLRFYRAHVKFCKIVLKNRINTTVLRTHMQKWKYMQSNKDAEWNKFGKSGWEMVTVLQAKDGSYLAFFKKPLN